MPDIGHEKTDELLNDLEKKIQDVYKGAVKQATEKYNKYMADFARKEEQHKKDVKTGKWSQEQFEQWRQGQVLTSKRLKDMENVLAQDLHNADKIAMNMVYDNQIDVYALNHNYGTYEIEKDSKINTSYTLYNHEAVESLIRDDPELLPKPSAKRQKEIDAKDIRWNKQKLTSAFTQSILNGDSIPHMAKAISSVAKMDRNAAVRNARTMTTGAEARGRLDAYKRGDKLGITGKKKWISTHDSRTRDSHVALDGAEVELDKSFNNGCMYPGDPSGRPSEVYNCRCTVVYVADKVNYKKIVYDKSGRYASLHGTYDSFEAWQKALESVKKTPTSFMVDGKDISETWQRRENDFDFEIEDVMNAQGFDGLPKVVSEDEFNKAVKDSGFIAQRTYTGVDVETVQAYQNQLYSGKWYVDCSTGGAQYGQGMYCAASYDGTITDGIKEEMRHYQDLNVGRNRQTTANLEAENYYKNHLNLSDELTRLIYKDDILHESEDDDGQKIRAKLKKYSDNDIGKAEDLIAEVGKGADKAKNEVINMSDIEYSKKYSIIETLTLDKSAKIIKYDDLMSDYNASVPAEVFDQADKARNKVFKSLTKGLTADEKGYVKWNANMPVRWKKSFDTISGNEKEKLLEISRQAQKAFDDIYKPVADEYHKRYKENHEKYKDIGSYAVAKGYDAINAEGHGQSGSYTVVLNRTKCIFLNQNG